MTWATARLGDLAHFIRGVTFKPEMKMDVGESGSVVCFRTTNVQVKLDQDDLIAVPRSVVKRAEQFIHSTDILVSSANSWNLVGKACWVPELAYEATLGGFISAIRVHSSELDPRYLYHWFTSSGVQETVRSFGRRTTSISNLDFDRTLDLEIPLPPLPIQRRIAAVLDEVDALRQKREEVINKLYHLKEVLFLQTFGDPSTNPFAFPTGTVRDIVSTANYGTSSKAGAEGSLPILRMGNITYLGGWNLRDMKYIDIESDDIDKYTVKSGDILFNRTNSKELVGKMAVYREDNPMAFAGYLVRVRVNEMAHPEFLSAFFNTSYMKKRLQDSCKAIVGMANINAQEMQNYPIYIPPVALQREFARQLEGVRAIELKTLNALDQHWHLSASLQARAFCGTLTLRDLEAVL